jgi:HD-GYP domain-containing protein (c-di-GMP phosphodiesterase class II)
VSSRVVSGPRAGSKAAAASEGSQPAKAAVRPRRADKQRDLAAAHCQRVQTLLQVSLVINASLDLDEVMHLVLQQGMLALDAEAATFWLVEGERLTPRVVLGPKADAVRRSYLKSGEGLVGQAIVLRSGLLVDDVRRYPLWASHIDQASGFRTRTLLCVPLENRNQSLGAIQFVNKKGRRRFTNDDLQLATGLARQAALSLANSLMFEDAQRVHENLIRALVTAIEACDPYTAGHSERVRQYMLALADEVGLGREARRQAEWSGLLHDVGKIRVVPLILRKGGRLSAEERDQVRAHASVGADMIADLDPGLSLQPVIDAVRYHHEWWDGTGYPEGLRGPAIPLLARMVAIADTFDAMTSGRPYQPAVAAEEALAEIEAGAGSQFDPGLAQAFIAAGRRGLPVDPSQSPDQPEPAARTPVSDPAVP